MTNVSMVNEGKSGERGKRVVHRVVVSPHPSDIWA